MKTLLTTAAALFAASSAFAGTLVYNAPDDIAIEDPTRMGGSGAWLIPLVIIAVLALALTADSSETPPASNGSQ